MRKFSYSYTIMHTHKYSCLRNKFLLCIHIAFGYHIYQCALRILVAVTRESVIHLLQVESVIYLSRIYNRETLFDGNHEP